MARGRDADVTRGWEQASSAATARIEKQGGICQGPEVDISHNALAQCGKGVIWPVWDAGGITEIPKSEEETTGNDSRPPAGRSAAFQGIISFSSSASTESTRPKVVDAGWGKRADLDVVCQGW